jgi:hypothetical protein
MNEYDTFYQEFVRDISRQSINRVEVCWSNSINPCEVLNSIVTNDNDSSFWSQHGESIDRYKELITNYADSLDQISRYGNLDHLSLSDPVHIAYQAFHGSEPIDLIEYQGKLMIGSNGRHRIEAAKILQKQGIDIKLSGRITKYMPADSSPATKQSQHLNSTKMSYQIEYQIELLGKAKALFVEHAEKVQELTDHFNAGVRALEQEDLNHDYMDFLEEFLSDYIIKLKTIRETIEDEYLPHLQRKINYLEERE